MADYKTNEEAVNAAFDFIRSMAINGYITATFRKKHDRVEVFISQLNSLQSVQRTFTFERTEGKKDNK